ncbi:ABC transporter substrate-binding protein [Paenibacillus sp. PAMC21692]|jgi:raffinose/stachyose/melibiose transport system substrate-binding protein|uniref:ABC transporter substrate-binding protein n=1 Tax=Paenibacillus sp. PAMC21692 TaxID=2762320 RepID=UPI00164E8F2E|nr:extracellular solute-binding protein [Paenibacillus sp. PAMC21692]QNK56454.1 extracellular solute-binding protein [Paenibacillus sp. PAMC21692]
MSKSNRWFKSLLVTALSLSVVIAGCSSNGNNKPDSNGAEPGQDKAPVELRFAMETPKEEQTKTVWKEILDGYTSQHPNVTFKIEYTPNDGDAARTWMTTALIGGTAPDIFPSRYTWTHEDLNKDLLTDLTARYDEPNPYNEDKVWKDTFAPTVFNEMKNPVDGRLAGISLQTLAIRVFYNQDLFNKYNLEVPKTWTEFLNVQKTLKDAGVTPFAFANSKPGDNHLLWATNILTNQIAADKVASYDYNGNKQLELNEIVGAVSEKTIDLTSPEWNGVFPIIKDWSQYWAKGYNGVNGDTAKQMFLRGDVAMMMAGNFELKSIQDFSGRKFEYGTFALPYLTKAEHPDASERYYELGGYPDGVYTVPKTVTGEKLDVVVDVLKYLTSPDVASILGNKLYLTTTLSGAKLPDNLKGFEFVGDRILVNFYAAHIDKKLNEDLVRIGQLYLEGSIDLEKFTTEMNNTLTTDMAAAATQNSWNKDNGYGSK